MSDEVFNQERFNIAVWGIGKHAKNKILPALSASSAFNLVGIYSRNMAVVNECTKSFNCKHWSSPGDMLDDNELDIIYLSTPIGLHAEQGKMILHAGKHFWCEKPIASTYNGAQELVEIARRQDRTLFEGFMYQYHPQYLWLKKYISEQEFGSIQSINCRFGLPFLEQPGFRYSAELGGSALLDVGCYPLSAVLGLLSGSKPTVLHSETRYISGYEVDMQGFAILGYPAGTIAILEWGMGRGYRNEIDVWGENGSIYSDKIFSKASDYEPTFIIRDQKGNQSMV